MVSELPFVSVIIPCRNEAEFIRPCLNSVLANDYPKERLEVLVVDGMSDDGTRAITEAYAQRHSFVRLLDNPKKVTPAALNVGIANAKGEIVMRMDAHARFERDYISGCVRALDQHGADNAGGIMRTLPQARGVIGRAIAACLSHPFGVGNSYFRIHSSEPKWVDTVFGGCYRRDVFHRVGLFNEFLARGQDLEFNLRLKKAGGRTLIMPDMVSYYYARSDLNSFWRHNWSNGVWAVLPFLYSHVVPIALRHLMPLLFVTSLIGSCVLGMAIKPFFWLFLGIASAYGLANLTASIHIAWRERDPIYLLVMPWFFAMLHVAYGLGSLWGAIKLVLAPHFRRKLFRLFKSRGNADAAYE